MLALLCPKRVHPDGLPRRPMGREQSEYGVHIGQVLGVIECVKHDYFDFRVCSHRHSN